MKHHRPILALVALTLLSVVAASQLAAQAGGDHKSLRVGVRVSEALGLIERTGPDGTLVASEGNWFPTAFRIMIESNEFFDDRQTRLERGEAPMWLQDHKSGNRGDAPPIARGGPTGGAEMGTFYDRDGKLRLWQPNPPPRGRVTVLGLNIVDFVSGPTERTLDWDVEKRRAEGALGPQDSARLQVMQRTRSEEISHMISLYRPLRRLTAAAINSGETDLPVDADPNADPCAFGEDTLARVSDRLVQESDPSRIASLLRVFEETEGVSALRNCICRTHSSMSLGSVYYKNAPHGGSPSCEDMRNGPCISEAYGCFRAPFKPDSAALEACGAAKVVARALCEKSKKLGAWKK